MRILYMDCFLGFDAQMLLGALIDAGASVEIIRKDFENAGISADISISNTLRCSISCKRAEVITDSKPESYFVDNPMISSIFKDFEITPGTDPVTIMAVVFATEQLGIDYIISSDISLPENTDGRNCSIRYFITVTTLLKMTKRPPSRIHLAALGCFSIKLFQKIIFLFPFA